MILHLDRIRDGEPFEFERRIGLPEIVGEGGDPLLVGEVRMDGVARRGSRGVELEARWSATVRLPCSRCLEPFEWDLGDEVFLVLVAGPEPAAGGEHAMDPAEASVFRVEGPRADLRLVAAEQVQLALPLKPLCREGCAGLCPTCGTNRNRLECGCPSAEDDPRLAALRDLRDRMDRIR